MDADNYNSEIENISDIENFQMRLRLLSEDNIPAIEELLDKESQRLRRLQRLKEDGKLDFGDNVSPEELKELFSQICTEVDEFLGIQDGEVPDCGYFNIFKPGFDSTSILLLYALSAIGVAYGLTPLFTDQNPDIDHFISAALGALASTQAAISHLALKQPAYDLSSKGVTLKKVARTDLIPMAGHEYAHSIHDKIGIASKTYTAFTEGHARGVEKQLADNYREREE